MTQKVRTIWNEGKTQKARQQQLAALANFKPDERSFEALLTEVAEYAGFVAFSQSMHLQGPTKPRNSWKSLIEADELVILSQLLQLDIASIENEFYKRYNRIKTSNRKSQLVPAIRQANKLGSKLLEWHSRLSKINPEHVHYPIYREWDFALQNIHERARAFLDLEGKNIQDLSVSIFDVEDHFKTLLKTVHFLQSKHEQFIQLARNHSSHQPHVGLLISFLELIRNVQEKINTFHARHLDFYYRELLQLNPRAAKPDSVDLHLILDLQVSSFRLSKGTAFLAGQTADGEDLIFETSEEIQIDQSEVAELKGIFVRFDDKHQSGANHVASIWSAEYPLESADKPWPILAISPEDFKQAQEAELGFVICSPNLELNEGERTITLEIEGKLQFYQLRPEILKVVSPADNNFQDLVIGNLLTHPIFDSYEAVSLDLLFESAFVRSDEGGSFPISKDFIDQVLLLEDGRFAKQVFDRGKGGFSDSMTIGELIIKLENESNLSNANSIQNVLETIIGNTGPNPEKRYRKFRRLFLDAFNISYSTLEGWHEITPVSVEFSTKASLYQLKILLLLRPDLPAFQQNPLLNFNAPALKCVLNDKASNYAYDFLKNIFPSKIVVHAEVKEVKNLVLYNQIGQLNTDTPFLPFGPTPNNYSYLLIGNKEVFRKKIHALNLHIDWMDLPTGLDGFKSHYAKYGIPITNDLFRAEISMLTSGSWHPKKKDRQNIRLFEGDGTIDPHSGFVLNTELLNANSAFDWSPEDLEYNKLTKRGFLKLQLIDPPFSFGHEKYPMILSKAAIQNAKKLTGLKAAFTKGEIQMELPNAPYTPKIDRISLDYSVKFEMDFRANTRIGKDRHNELFHIEPFQGYKKLYATNDSVCLIPTLNHEGALYLGIRNFKSPGILSMLFEMTESIVDQDSRKREKVLWGFLVNNEWKSFRPDQIVSDTTDSLIHSGIVMLDIPEIKESRNTLLSDELLWIRLAMNSDTHLLGRVIRIVTNAVRATFRGQAGHSTVTHRIDPNSISGPVTEVPQLAEVRQPMSSFGGESAEPVSQFNLRISERLRHKNRCVSLYDYERIILEAFPSINKVLCINSYDWTRNQPKAGKVLLVLVPLIGDTSLFNIVTPTNSVRTLRGVRELVQRRSSPFIEFDVINPTYEHVRVHARVKLKSGNSSGGVLRLLNEEIRQFISPWIKDSSLEPIFQKRIALEEIQSFIQSRPYVDFVTKVSMVKVDNNIHEQVKPYALTDTGMDLLRDNEISGRYPWTILTTATTHFLEIIEEDKSYKPNKAGLNKLYLNEDFVITGQTK